MKKNYLKKEIVEITLLSDDEYLLNENNIPLRSDEWWLRSPCTYDGKVYESFAVAHTEHDSLDGYYVTEKKGVCPAIRIRDLGSCRLVVGDRFKLAGNTWTVISGELALCDHIVGESCFRKNGNPQEANDYEKSDVKKWLENWAAENGIFVNADPVTV